MSASRDPLAAGAMPHGLAMQLQAYDPARAAEPLLPVSPEDWEQRARELLADGPSGYVAGGARAVGFGRPYAYALAVAGEAGVRHALRCLLADLDLAPGWCGPACVAEVDAPPLA